MVNNLGQILNGTEKRDAVHIAIVPVKAGYNLEPGEKIGIDREGEAVASGVKLIGVVDPLLKSGPVMDQWFYMWMMPDQISGLRHEWSHPDLPDTAPPAKQEEEEEYDECVSMGCD